MKKILESIKNYYLLIILLFIIILLVFIYTYKVYSNIPIDNQKLYITSKVELKSKELDSNHQIKLAPNENKTITIIVKNNFNTDKKYTIWYKSLAKNNDIQLTSSSFATTLTDENNIIEKSSQQEISINIKNKNASSIQVEFGVAYTNPKDKLILPDESISIKQKINTNKIKEYSIGDKVILNKQGSWHVIQESLIDDEYIVLLSDKTIKLDDDNQSLDSINNKVLFKPNDDNIKFYLENTYKKLLEENNIMFGDAGEIRLITLKELLAIGSYNYKEYNYYKNDTPEWINTNTPWWTMTPYSISSTYYVQNGNIYFSKDQNATRAAIRPVIKVLKSNIKT